MTSERHDHAPIVEAWLKEPIWLSEGDTARIAQLVHQTPQQRGWLRPIISRSTHHMFTATKFVAAGIVLAAAGGLLLYSGGLMPQDDQGLPGASSEQVIASGEPTLTADPSVSTEPEVTATDADGTLVMGPPDADLSAAGWTEAGQAPFYVADGTGFGELSDLQAIGDQLVALGSTLDSEEGPSHDVVMLSADGQTWTPVAVPGDDPVLNDMAANDDGLVIAGLDKVDGERVARLWTSIDGLEWQEFPAPEGVAAINQIVSAQDPLVVRANQRVYTFDNGAWSEWGRFPNSQIMRGPGGYLIWQGGGQDLVQPLAMIHASEPGGKLEEVQSPGRLGNSGANGGIQLFVVDDRWVMVPESETGIIYTSTDGVVWEFLPRPDRMLGGSVEWMGMVGDELQAFGLQARKNSSPSGFWTIAIVAEAPAEFEMLDPDGDQHMGTPVAFGDGYVATGYYGGPGNAITTWQHATAE